MAKKHIFLLIYIGSLVVSGCQPNPNPPTQIPSTEQAQIIATSTPSPTPQLEVTVPAPELTIKATVEPSPEATATLPAPSPTQQVPTNLPTATPVSTELASTDSCIDEAAFFADVTVPDDTLFNAGDPIDKIWQVRNTGTCVWNSGYSLVFAKGDIMDGPLSNPLSVVAPGDIAEISVNLVAPSRGGQQTGYWQFQNPDGTRFGVGSGGHDYIWVQIQVDWSSLGGDQQQSPEATSEPADSGGSPSCSAAQNTSYENQVLSLINSARESAGLPGLSLNYQLADAALIHSQDMACVDFIDHTGSDGSTWYDRVAAQGYANYSSARENIYVGDPNYGGTPDGAFTWWMNSQVHRDNILNPNVSEIGIGYVYYADSSYGGYYTVVFARP